MYYNSAGPGQAHYNVTAVQGSGDVDSATYGEMRSTMDKFNTERLYADHAGEVVPGYADKQPDQGNLAFSSSTYHPQEVPQKLHSAQTRRFLGLPVWLWFMVALFVTLLWVAKSGRVPKLNLSDRKTQRVLIVVVAALWLLFFFKSQ